MFTSGPSYFTAIGSCASPLSDFAEISRFCVFFVTLIRMVLLRSSVISAARLTLSRSFSRSRRTLEPASFGMTWR